MNEPIVFNGKEYVPSTTLARTCGYSADYISKLAREEEILGTQIDRQWYVEPESLHVFLIQAAASKKIRAEALRNERKKERLKKELLLKSTSSVKTYPLLEAATVSLCLAFFCLLAWTTVDSKLTSSDFFAGAYYAADVLVEGITSPSAVADTENNRVWSDSVLAPSSDQLHMYTSEERTGTFTSLPVVTQGYDTPHQSIKESFSDEVIVTEINGDTYVTPIFKDNEMKAEPIKVYDATQL